MIKELLALIPPLKKSLKYVLITALVLEMLKLVPHIIFKELIDSLIGFDNSRIAYMVILIGISLAVAVFVAVLEKYIFMRNHRIVVDSEIHLLKRCQQKLMDLTLGYHEKHNTGKQVALFTKGIHNLDVLVWHTIFDFLPTIFQVLYSTVIIFFISWKAGLVFLVFIPIFLVYTSRISRSVQQLRMDYHEIYDDATGKLGEMVINIKTVKDYSQEEREKRVFEDYMARFRQKVLERTDYEQHHSMLRDMLMQIIRVVILTFSIYLVYVGEVTAGGLVLIVTLNEKAFASVGRFGRTYTYVGDSISGLKRLMALMDEEVKIKDKENAVECANLDGSIRFSDVSFSYADDEEVLKNIDFSVEPKQVVAFVGKSGSGKSTLVKLLYRHFDIQSGKIMYNGVEIRDYKIASLRKHLAIVSQDVELFNATIRDNISYGVDSFTEEELTKAAKMANAHEFISKFSHGYDTIVGEKGVKLSGGQKQRVGIARALLRRPAILIFDEATSSLDTASEKAIQKAMDNIFKKQTMIIIAHRLSTIEHADKVIVLDEGKIVEQGSPSELLKKEGVFRRMRELQKLGELR